MELREDTTLIRRRTAALLLLVFAALGLLHLRLFDLQVLHGREWRDLAENNRLRRLPLPAPRGWIYDRRGRVLAENLPTWEVLLYPDEAEDLEGTALFLAREGISDARAFHARLAERRISRLAPVVVGENLSWNQVAAVRARQGDFPELSVVSRIRRHYPYGPLTAHVVGHLRPVSKARTEAEPGLEPDAMVGATGIEAAEDAFIAGRSGERFLMVSAVGRQLGVVRESEPQPGNDLGLTLDVALQQEAAAELGERAGAVVALDPRTGAVRVLYSSPSFDPEIFGGRLSRADWLALQEDPEHALQNRCLQGVYPPGSTIKPFLAMAGLSEGLVDPSTTVYCNGSIVLYGHRFRCWRRGGHGFVDLERSLEESCDIYYYLLGQRLGIDTMAEWLGRFGFGRRTGLDPRFEAEGLVGTPEWSRRVRKTAWYAGDAVSVSIGQGPVLATTVQLAAAYAALANQGRIITPHLVAADREPEREIGFDQRHLAEVTAALARVVHGPQGTARRLAGLPIAGKTGTAQVVRLQEGVSSADLAPKLRHHALFVGWAPLDDPSLVVAVVVEHGGDGGSAAAPVVGRVIAAHLQQGGADTETPAPAAAAAGDR